MLSEWIAPLLPAEISPFLFLVLILVSFLTSGITAVLGAGGGLLMLATLSNVVPPFAIIPVHGLVQLGSNSGRAAMTFKHIHWHTISRFVPGLILGAIVGSLLLVQLPESVWQLSIATFVLYLCWGPSLPKLILGDKGIFLLGAVTTFLTLFVGATGPLISAYLKNLYENRYTTIATMAATLVLQHCTKFIVFGLAGFNFAPWLVLIAGMIAGGALGTWAGLRLQRKITDKRFNFFLNVVLTVLSLRLIYQALT